MAEAPVVLGGSGPPETILDAEAQRTLSELAAAMQRQDRVASLCAVCSRWPQSLEAWASLGESLAASGQPAALAYAAFRTGYHRGLDRLRASGWRGSGFVRWSHRTNRGFLRCVQGLQRCATEIGETQEAERCALFLRQLDPEWPPVQRED